MTTFRLRHGSIWMEGSNPPDRQELVIRGDWEGFALYLEKPGSVEPGECVGVFKTLTGAARARAAAQELVAQIASPVSSAQGVG